MIENHSPWIKQLKRNREAPQLNNNISTDIVIVGGGIAGVTTAFFILGNTDKKVVLLEADKIAHGATGHNAGQITSYFERPLSDLVEEFGFELAIDAQRSIESGWTLLDQIVAEAKIQTPIFRFTGYAGLSNLEQVLLQLKNNLYRAKGGLPLEQILVAEECEERNKIPDEYKDFYKISSHKDILQLLETDNTSYVASLAYGKGCMNSALFTEELIGYISDTYKERFSFYEKSPVKTVRLSSDRVRLEVLEYIMETEKVVLCTNGFENFSIINESGKEIDTKFHHSVMGRIGYMSGYIEPISHPPVAISYFSTKGIQNNDPTGQEYFYLTRRPHEHEGSNSFNLICAGGPEKVLPNGASYSREEEYSEEMRTVIDDFLKDNYNKYPDDSVEYAFSWHGLMGYTPNGIRRVGPEPLNKTLLYNLGCNGVGILPSIFGSSRIAKFLKGDEAIPPSIFDPVDQR